MKIQFFILTLLGLLSVSNAIAQDVERVRPKEWNGLVEGGMFMHRFLPIPTNGKLTSDTWGAKATKPRYTDNGIEDKEWSYWGGNIVLGEDGKYHQFPLCRI